MLRLLYPTSRKGIDAWVGRKKARSRPRSVRTSCRFARRSPGRPPARVDTPCVGPLLSRCPARSRMPGNIPGRSCACGHANDTDIPCDSSESRGFPCSMISGPMRLPCGMFDGHPVCAASHGRCRGAEVAVALARARPVVGVGTPIREATDAPRVLLCHRWIRAKMDAYNVSRVARTNI